MRYDRSVLLWREMLFDSEEWKIFRLMWRRR